MKQFTLVIVAGFTSFLVVDTAWATSFLYSKALADTLAVTDDIDEGTETASAQVAGGSVSALVATDYGINKAKALAFSSSAVAQGTSQWVDTLLVGSDNPADDGQEFSATFYYHLDGIMFVSGGGGSIMSFDFSYDPEDQTSIGEQTTGEFIRHQTPGTLDIDIDGSLTFDFKVGEAFEFEALLFVNADTGSSPGTASTDFYSTATVTGVTLPDGFTLSSESGTAYGVPEPSGAILSLVGLIWTIIRRRSLTRHTSR